MDTAANHAASTQRGSTTPPRQGSSTIRRRPRRARPSRRWRRSGHACSATRWNLRSRCPARRRSTWSACSMSATSRRCASACSPGSSAPCTGSWGTGRRRTCSSRLCAPAGSGSTNYRASSRPWSRPTTMVFTRAAPSRTTAAGALEQLCLAVRPYPSLFVPLVGWLLREQLLEQCNGMRLAIHCFATTDYKDYSILIRIAIFNIDEMLSSAFGSRLLTECFFNARHDELCALEEIILSSTSEFAKGQYSNYFLQRVLERSYPPLNGDVVERVAADVASLAADRFGSCVVETCILRTRSPAAALQRVLAAFLGLRDGQLAELVRGGYSSHVVRKLLATGKDRFTEETMTLARRIEKLPAAVREEVHARQVMEVVKSLLPCRSARTTHDDACKYLPSCL
ncbi:hypothetical protein ACP70R_013605 [Stipagrostis hirtigluma subsp. patula]